MFNIFKAKPSKREQDILDRINYTRDNGFSSMHVNKEGAMAVDVKQVIRSESFRRKAASAREIVSAS
jgi:hypothetical protein